MLGILLKFYFKKSEIGQDRYGLITIERNKRILFLGSPRLILGLSIVSHLKYIYICTHIHVSAATILRSVTRCRRLWTVVVSWPCITVTGQTSPTMVVLLESWEAGKRLIIMQLTLSYSITVAAGYRCSRRGQFEEQFATRYREQHHPSTVLADDIDTRLPHTLVRSQPSSPPSPPSWRRKLSTISNRMTGGRMMHETCDTRVCADFRTVCCCSCDSSIRF